ncbi:transcriptional regulator with XRE-family HTH domain [Weissella uvarum]|uniref:helix-turn-helix domain-containing protein n=1 Tax=Weissella uvarum TaxID=1479233 RepID=UPI00196208C0|nr:helix-turn-helix transcriptional regulator [Weissella uvarum]MBM7617601.1 transcriptional regulator with XRE-family HTH domain [Weissella uvarum]MCM0595952.1 helix-turn-helix transcriptional regulator [Weissella uvarum]
MNEEVCSSHIGTNIKQLRNKHGLTQSEMADALSIDVTTLSHSENGLRIPNIDILVAIERLLDEDIHNLIGDHYQ